MATIAQQIGAFKLARNSLEKLGTLHVEMKMRRLIDVRFIHSLLSKIGS